MFHKHLKSINDSGFDHVLLPLACFVVFALIGSFYLYHSLAATSVQWKGVLEDYRLSSGYCLTTTGSTKASLVELDPCSKTYDSKQVWSLVDVRKATVSNESNVQEFYLQSADGGECIDNWGASKKTSYPEKLYPCSTTDSAVTWIWGAKFTSRGYSSHQLSNMAAASMCLDDRDGSDKSGTYVGLYTCKTTAQSNQEWFEQGAPSSSGSGSGSGSSTAKVGCYSGSTAAPCIGSTTTGASGWGTPTFQSIFDGTSVNTSQWTVEGPQAPNNSQEYDCYSPTNVSEGGGTLSLKLTSTKCTVGSSSWSDTGAQMDTSKQFNQTYGYYEARVYMPGSGGTVANWGAFWLTNNNWPNDGEIDIVEGYHGTAGYHFEYAPSGSAIWQGGQASGNWTGWHTYGVNWQANSVTFYYDGKEMGSYTTGASSNHYPMFILLDYTTGPEDNVGGPSVVPDTMQVQYVRAWK